MKQAHLTVMKTLVPTMTEDVMTALLLKVEPTLYLVQATAHLEFWWCPSFQWRSQGIEIQEAHHTNKDSTPIMVILIFFMEVISCW
jgi:hypothetical protein